MVHEGGVRMQQRYRCIGWALVLLVVLAWPLQASAAPDFPEPLGLVSDFANVLGMQERVEIQRIAEKLWQSNGVELAVVTVEDTSPLDTDTYTFRLFRAWGIGEAKADNGLLVLLNMGEREIRIEVGTGLEGYVNDAKAGRILDAALPDLQAGRFGQGLVVISQELAEAVQAVPGEGKELWDVLPQVGPVGGILLLYIGLILFAALSRQHGLLYFLLRLPGLLFSSGRGGRGGGGSFGGFGGGKSSGGGARRKF